MAAGGGGKTQCGALPVRKGLHVAVEGGDVVPDVCARVGKRRTVQKPRGLNPRAEDFGGAGRQVLGLSCTCAAKGKEGGGAGGAGPGAGARTSAVRDGGPAVHVFLERGCVPDRASSNSRKAEREHVYPETCSERAERTRCKEHAANGRERTRCCGTIRMTAPTIRWAAGAVEILKRDRSCKAPLTIRGVGQRGGEVGLDGAEPDDDVLERPAQSQVFDPHRVKYLTRRESSARKVREIETPLPLGPTRNDAKRGGFLV